jgi:hypothetical protein
MGVGRIQITKSYSEHSSIWNCQREDKTKKMPEIEMKCVLFKELNTASVHSFQKREE